MKKSPFPNNKHQVPNKHQITITQTKKINIIRFVLGFRICLDVGMWNFIDIVSNINILMMKYENMMLSVIIHTYNRASFIKEAIQYVLDHDYFYVWCWCNFNNACL